MTLEISRYRVMLHYIRAFVNIAKWWRQHKEQVSKEEMVRQITKLIEKLYDAAAEPDYGLA